MGRLMMIAEVAERLRVSKATIYGLLQTGEFPPGIRISPSRRVWSEEQIDQWLKQRSEVVHQ